MTSTSRHRLSWPTWALALLLGCLALVTTLGGSPVTAPSVATAQGGDGRYSVLVFSRTTGFRHTEAIDAGRDALQQMGVDEDFDVTLSEDAGDFTSHSLRDFDVVVFLNTDGEGILNQDQRTAFERWTQAGGGAVRIHADANADKDWDWKTDMQGGGTFNNHPPIQEATMEVADPTHPATDDLPAEWVWSDEWYNFDADPREDVHVLLTVDESTYDGGEHGEGHPIAWCSNYDGGRNFYTAIGHQGEAATDAWSDENYLAHISGALEWAAGEEPGDCGDERPGLPTEASLNKVTLDDETENPMELAVANDGRVFFVEIGAGAVDSFDSAVKMYDPATDETYVVGEIPVHRYNENGLLGIALDPNFDDNNFVYLFYSIPGPQNEMGTQHISRFTFDPSQGEVGALDIDSEVVLLEIPHQRHVCCHSAGSLAFGPDGFLYTTTGDDTTPFETNGYAPIDARDCGPGDADGCDPDNWPADSVHAYDARRTSGNAADLRGKLLRIDPIESATPEDEPGEGSTYEVPDDNLFTSGQYDHLFPDGVYDPELGRPEIYAMGFRNPFRLTVDPATGSVYVGQVGPDANNDCFPGDSTQCTNNPRGPRGYDAMMQIDEAANMGWPYCLAGQGYFEYDYATGTSGDQYDCENGPTNDSPHNTGIDTLPPVTDPLIWYPYGDSPEFPEIPSGNARAAMAGPVYNYDPELDSDVKLSEYFDGTLFWGDWSRNVMLNTTLDENGDYVTTDEFMPNEEFRHPHDIEIGPDGALYVIEWGLNFNFGAENINPDSGLYRIEQRTGGLAALASAQADPSAGPAPLEVQFTGELSDRGADEPPTYEWDFGDGETSDEVNPTHTYTEVGTYEATLTVTDAAGETTDTVTVNARDEAECGPPFSDDFEGSELDTEKWTVVREEPERLSVEDGSLNIVSAPQDIFGGATGLPNIVLQDIPGGGVEPWSFTTEMTWEPSENFNNAGLLIYVDDANWLKFGQVWNGSRQFEMWKEIDDSPGEEAFSGDVGDEFPTTFWMRYTSPDGNEVTAEYSADGEDWETLATRDLEGLEDAQIGLYATAAGADTEPTASYHSVAVEPDREPCADDTTPPATTHSLDPEDPGEGGTYDGPVDVTLSATDPEDGGGPGVLQTHEVNAQPATWDPDQLEIALGDNVQWNFPASGQFQHDVWLIEPGEPADSDGFQVTDAPVPAGGDPVTYTFEESGAWTYLCKIHSFVDDGAWQGMVGTAQVGDGGGPGEASGVDFTEYRVNTDGQLGEWVRSDNGAEDDPFETEFTVSDEGGHQIEYRSVDNAGNVQETQSVSFDVELGAGGLPGAGSPDLTASVKPKKKTVGNQKERTGFRFSVANTGDGDAGTVRLCAKARKKKLKVQSRCSMLSDGIPAGATRAERYSFKIKPKARGKRTRIRFVATAPGVEDAKAAATLRVRKRR
jgi:glucose/arabinose dehydrogenase/PKD repeat protein